MEEEIAHKNERHILLVDDNQMNREFTAELLSYVGFQVETAKSGFDALALLQKKGAGSFDVVLLDIRMPGMNGYETAEKIRGFTDERLARIPIVALSADSADEMEPSMDKSLMDAYVTKPIQVQRLVTILEKLWQ